MVSVEMTTGSSPLPKITVGSAEFPSGRAVRLVRSYVAGSGRDDELVRGGDFVMNGRQRIFVDASAPVNERLRYRLIPATGTIRSTPYTTRPYAGWDLITSLDGRTVVDFRWMKSGGAPWAQRPQFAAFDVPGRPRSLLHLGPVAGAGGGSLRARMDRAGTVAMQSLVAANRPVLLIHNPARCFIPECDLPAVETVFFTSAPNDRTPAVNRAERDWELDYLLVDDPEPDYVVPVSTLADLRAADVTLAELRAMDLTVAEWNRMDWSAINA